MENSSYSYNYNEPHISVYLTLFDNSMLLDEVALNIVINLLNKMYFNHLLVLFLMSSMATLYVCSGVKKNKDHIMLKNVEPKILRGEVAI